MQGDKHWVMTNWTTMAVFIVLVFALVALPTSTGFPTSPHQRSRREGKFLGTYKVDRERVTVAEKGMVAADDERCSQIGRDIMRADGNAVDAAVATAFCLGVVNPMASGIGGGAFFLLRLSNGTSLAYDMRETAPAAATEDMYNDNPESKRKGALSIGVPGEVAGLHLVWSQHGRLPWEELMEPAIALAETGFIVQPYLAYHIEDHFDAILADKGLRETFAPNGIPLTTGDICYRNNLANTLKQIAKHGPKALYTGRIAEKVVDDVTAAGGILTLEDLRDYKVAVRRPLVAETMGYTVIGMPPPSSGGASLVLILNILAKYKSFNAFKGLLGLHRMIEAFKHTYAVRMNLGDPEFVDVESVVADMLNPVFAASLQRLIADNTTFPQKYYGGRWSQLNDHGTSHFSIVDAERNAVGMTTSINFPFGALILSPDTGIVLNNEMDDFSIPIDPLPGSLPPAPQNFVRPGKRPLSSMSPTIVVKNGHLHGVLGGSGGIRIITSVAQVFLNQFVKNMDALLSITAYRLHHQLGPNYVQYENYTIVTGKHLEVSEPIRHGLESKGHVLQPEITGAVCQMVVQDLDEALLLPSWVKERPGIDIFYGKLIGVSDERKDGAPAGL